MATNKVSKTSTQNGERAVAFGFGAIALGLMYLLQMPLHMLINNLVQSSVNSVYTGDVAGLIIANLGLYLTDVLLAIIASLLTVALLVVTISRLFRQVGWEETRNAMGLTAGFMVILGLGIRALVQAFSFDNVAAEVGLFAATLLGTCFAFAAAWETAGAIAAKAGSHKPKATAKRKAA